MKRIKFEYLIVHALNWKKKKKKQSEKQNLHGNSGVTELYGLERD